jgi:hypothetical protein
VAKARLQKQAVKQKIPVESFNTWTAMRLDLGIQPGKENSRQAIVPIQVT